MAEHTTRACGRRDPRTAFSAALHARPQALFGGLTAAEVHGLRNWNRDDVTVLVPPDLSFAPVEGVRFVRCRRPLRAMRSRLELPVCQLEPALLLFAARERDRRTAHGCLAAAVQQRLTTPKKLGYWVEWLRPLRRAAEFRTLLVDPAGGAQSVAELDIRRARRAFGSALPLAQTRRRDRSGRFRFTDAEWRLPDGRTLVLEIDGAFHDDVVQAADDKSRARKLAAVERDRDRVLRLRTALRPRVRDRGPDRPRRAPCGSRVPARARATTR